MSFTPNPAVHFLKVLHVYVYVYVYVYVNVNVNVNVQAAGIHYFL